MKITETSSLEELILYERDHRGILDQNNVSFQFVTSKLEGYFKTSQLQ